MSSILDRIVADKRVEVADRKRAAPRAELERRARACRRRATSKRPCVRPGRRADRRGQEGLALPRRAGRRPRSGGAGPDATREHGAHAISVLTDEKYFKGHLDLLAAIRARVTVPLLRKDFTIDEWQLWESRAAGADAVLLIVSILEPALLRDLLAATKGLGLAALVECHTAAELDRALSAGSRIVGINNRDLATFETTIETTLALLPLIPPGPIVISESGFFHGDQVRRVVAAGARAVLVGEGLVRAADVGGKVRELTLR